MAWFSATSGNARVWRHWAYRRRRKQMGQAGRRRRLRQAILGWRDGQLAWSRPLCRGFVALCKTRFFGCKSRGRGSRAPRELHVKTRLRGFGWGAQRSDFCTFQRAFGNKSRGQKASHRAWGGRTRTMSGDQGACASLPCEQHLHTTSAARFQQRFLATVRERGGEEMGRQGDGKTRRLPVETGAGSGNPHSVGDT
jgi:hypothetical protein